MKTTPEQYEGLLQYNDIEHFTIKHLISGE